MGTFSEGHSVLVRPDYGLVVSISLGEWSIEDNSNNVMEYISMVI